MIKSGRVYTLEASFTIASGSASFFQVVVGDTVCVQVLGWSVTQSSEFTGDEEEGLNVGLAARHGPTAITPAAGTSLTARPAHLGDPPADIIATFNVNANSVGGSTLSFYEGIWMNNRAGIKFMYPPDCTPIFEPEAVFALRNSFSANDSIDYDAALYFRELGGA